MNVQKMKHEIMEYIVWVIEIAAAEFFGGDKTSAYAALKKCGLYDVYIDNYETTHTLGREYILNEIKERLETSGANT